MRNNSKTEEGLVAILVATIITVILSLVTLGFARIMRSEQRQAIDRSLSTQAFYAAESAVNNVTKRIQNGTYTIDKTSCAPDATFDGQVDGTIGAEYTCLLIDQAPDTLEYTQGSISTDSSKVIPVRAENNADIGRIRIAWEEDASRATSLAAPTFIACPASPVALPALTAWTQRTGMIRLDVIPADSLDRQVLIDKMVSLYLYPCSGGGSVSSIDYSNHVAQNQKGQIIPVSCSAAATPRDCELTIVMNNASPLSAPNKRYYLRAKSIYKSSDMTIRLFDTALTPNQLSIKDAQVQIDSTGKVADIVRRIQVRIPVSESFQIPEYSIQTTDSICKRLQIIPAPINSVEDGCP